MIDKEMATNTWPMIQQAVMVGDHSTPWWVYAIVAGVALIAIGVCLWFRRKDRIKPKHWKK